MSKTTTFFSLLLSGTCGWILALYLLTALPDVIGWQGVIGLVWIVAMTVLWVSRCRHGETYREVRRGRWHYVCDDCGHAWPMVREPGERQLSR